MRTELRGIAIVLVLLAACVGERPVVERFDGGAWEPRPFRVASLTGRRDGTALFFSLRLQGEPTLLVEGALEIDPRPRLVSGRWTEEDGAGAGSLSSATVYFFGGQGGRPSLRGQLTLSSSGSPVYRVNLPTTALGSGEGRPVAGTPRR